MFSVAVTLDENDTRILDSLSCTSAVIKRQPALETTRSIKEQIIIISVPTTVDPNKTEFNVENLKSLMKYGVGSYFGLLENNNQLAGYSQYAIGNTKFKIKNLLVDIQALQQTIQAPDLLSNIPSAVQKWLQDEEGKEMPQAIEESTELMNDVHFLNSLQSLVHSWVKKIQSITQLDHNPSEGAVRDEIAFWDAKENALISIRDQLTSPNISLILEALKCSKRSHTAVALTSSLSVKGALKVATSNNDFLKTLNIDNLSSAENIEDLHSAIGDIFESFKKLKILRYPIEKAVVLLKLVTEDFESKLIDIVSKNNLFLISTTEFENIRKQVNTQLDVVENSIRIVINLLRGLLRKQDNIFLPIKIDSPTFIKTKMNEIKIIRDDHDSFTNSIISLVNGSEPLSNEDVPAYQKIYNESQVAYESLSTLPISKIFDKESMFFNSHRTNYYQQISFIEKKMVNIIKRLLTDVSEDPTALFVIFQKFQTLLNKPQIRLMLQQFHNILLQATERELDYLENQFLYQSQVKSILTLRQLPTFSAKMVWIKQLLNSIAKIFNHLELILTKDWSNYPEGKRFSTRISTLLSDIDIDGLLAEWTTVTNNRMKKSFLKSHILIETALKSGDMQHQLNMNYEDLEICQEIVCSKLLGLKIPASIEAYGCKMYSIQKYASLIDELLRQFYDTLAETKRLGDLAVLPNPIINEVFSIIQHLSDGTWLDVSRAAELMKSEIAEKNVLISQIHHLQTNVTLLSDYFHELAKIKQEYSSLIHQIEQCSYRHNILSEKITSLQNLINKLHNRKSLNLTKFVNIANLQLEKILAKKCQSELEKFQSLWTSKEVQFFHTKKIHKIVVQNFSISIKPALHSSKKYFLELLNSQVLVVKNQRSLVIPNYDKEVNGENFYDFKNYNIQIFYRECYRSILSSFHETEQFVHQWESLQLLWDYDDSELKFQNDQDLKIWQQILSKLKEMRDIFDTLETSRAFGLLRIDYEQAQSRISSKFDAYQKALLESYGSVLKSQIISEAQEVRQIKLNLEDQSFDLSNPISIIMVLSSLVTSEEFLLSKRAIFSALKEGQALLSKYRYKFSSDWIYFSQINDDLQAIRSLSLINSEYLDSHYDIIQAVIKEEIQNFSKIVLTTKTKWERQKPQQGSSVQDAVLVLQDFEVFFNDLEKSYQRLHKACNLVGLKFGGDLQSELDEIEHLQHVWSYIMKLYNTLDAIRATEWLSCNTGQIRVALEDSLSLSRKLDVEIRSYPAFENAQIKIKETLKAIPLLTLLQNDALQLPHWEGIFQQIMLKKIPETLSVGDILDLNLLKNEKYLKVVITKAEAEKVLDSNIKDIEQVWKSYKFEVYETNSHLTLISGWSNLLASIEDHLNMLESIKVSPYYPRFSNRVKNFEKRLMSMSQIVNIWHDAQKQWVYLLGIFKDKDRLEKLMPLDVSRFENISYEFKNLTSEALSVPVALEITDIPDILKSIQRLSESLYKIRKSLVGYLEKQRELFPRFYFMGNDDLLELIGNSTNIMTISKHIKKLFPGISSLNYDENLMLINSIVSSEGEELVLRTPVSLAANEYLIDWLKILENNIKLSLSEMLAELVEKLTQSFANHKLCMLTEVLSVYPNQIIILAYQIYWTSNIEKAVMFDEYSNCKQDLSQLLSQLTGLITTDISALIRIKAENLLIELIHKSNTINQLIENCASSLDHFIWFSEQKFYFEGVLNDKKIAVKMKHGNYVTDYGFEYLGAIKKLAYTPLLNSTFMLLSEALDQHLGGLLLGPAGTGKTESIKALGYSVGRSVFVFCCDETFDVESVSRILVGITQIGGWSCFDEFNRLEEKILSGISTRIEKIQNALSTHDGHISLLSKSFTVDKKTGIFITNNPSYEGRSTLPDNLTSKFISFSLVVPDSEVITEVLLATQGFKDASSLASILVNILDNMNSSCSAQKHYDFGLRSLKSIIVHAGKMKRSQNSSESSDAEIQIIQRSCYDVILPRLLPFDEKIFFKEISKFNVPYSAPTESSGFRKLLLETAKINGYAASDEWLVKSMQIYEIQKLNHGFMLVGPSFSGKTGSFTCFANALTKFTNIQNECIRIDAKVLNKHTLFGQLDYATREWKDGLVTMILRKANDNTETNKNIWVIFDGDIDPNWVENLNSVLDDNRLLTLPNGERITLPENVKIVFETDNLRHVTPATISRCGIIMFDKSQFKLFDIFKKVLIDFKRERLKNEDLYNKTLISYNLTVNDFKEMVVNCVLSIVDDTTLQSVWKLAKSFPHVLHSNKFKAVSSFVEFLRQTMKTLLEFINKHPHNSRNNFDSYFKGEIVLCIFWSFGSELTDEDRKTFAAELLKIPNFGCVVPASIGKELFQSHVSLPDGKFELFDNKLQKIDIEPGRILGPGIVIPTVDTCIYEKLIYSILDQHKPLILCGPPGSGKTMLLLASVRKSAGFDLVGMNFSKETTVNSVLKALEQCCEYKKSVNGVTLCPRVLGKWIVLFCDELNLPKPDNYGTQEVIQFLRQLLAEKGFWHPKRCIWVTIKSIQFVGACNPTSTSGRVFMTERFTNLCTTVMIDYPSIDSLRRIYGVYSNAILKTIPDLVVYAQSFSSALIDVYQEYQTHFKGNCQPHYLCSPRELTRWVKSVYRALKSISACDLDGLIRLWAYESLRLFSDRLILGVEKEWFFNTVVDVAKTNFPFTNLTKVLCRPILFSDWLNYEYQSVDKLSFEKFLEGRFNVFNEEESNVNIVLYEEVLDHILRIDRVLKNAQGHMILVGPSGSGKTTLAKFVSWMNGINVAQLNVSKRFNSVDFDKVLKALLQRAAIGNEKLCFIIDESTILESSFLEKMNTLLANAEVPGLFEEEEFEALINSCSKASRDEGLILNSTEEIYQWFVQRIAENFHVIFTMSDNKSTNSHPFISSSALFNRCVINWMGDWSVKSFKTVASKLTKSIPLDNSDYKMDDETGKSAGLRSTVIELLVSIHITASNLEKHISPSHFLNFLKTFSSIFINEESSLQELSSHVSKGLTHLREAFLRVKRLGATMLEKEEELKAEDLKARKLLDKMITDQNESERKQDMSVKMQELFAEQEQEIMERREVVVKELGEVQKLIEEAQKGVLDIKKQHLNELRSMHNPPETIKLVLESICIMLGYKVENWRSVQHVIRQDDFIASIITFKGDKQLTPEILSFMEDHYLSKSNFNYESANRASKACGPLFTWVEAQLKFSAIVVKFAPLKNELRILEEKLVDTKAKLIAINSLIKDLQDEVEKYKAQYSETIRIKENIRIEMETVKKKLDRSVELLSSLGSERQRWEANVLEYQKQKNSMVGNTILSSAFITYCGSLAPAIRAKLFNSWEILLAESHLAFDVTQDTYLLTSVLSAESIIKWQDFGLPNDEQFIGNTAILVSRFNNRFPFIIDPSELLVTFLTRLSNPKPLVITSFLDPDFNKKLENCVKFGGSILIRDGEYFDPIINRLIAKDVRVMGAGRMVVKLGDKDVDMSPDFQLYIHTRDSTVNILPFISSRMNILNYSFTPESMINEALSLTLQVRQPEIEGKRLLLMKKNDECKEQLKKYEKELLELLSSSKDNILDDDNLLSKLEILKHEAKLLEAQMAESDTILRDYNAIRNEFKPLGDFYANLNKVFDEFISINKNYIFPKDNLKNILLASLELNPRSSVKELQIAFSQLIYKENSSSMLEKNKGVLRNLLEHFTGTTSYEGMSLHDAIVLNQFILLRSAKGNDATIKIKELSSSENVNFVKYAMGSNDSYDVASRMITELKDSNTWLIIENIELSTEFLEMVNEIISLLKGRDRAEHASFKLIMTSKIEAELPPLLLRSCKQIFIENEQGLKSNLTDQLLSRTSSLCLHKLSELRPKEIGKLYFVLVWFFSLVSSRLRFRHGGFTKRYEISQADLRNAERFIWKFIKTRYEPNKDEFEMNPDMFETIGQVISSLIFGGKFDNLSDLQKLQKCGFALFKSGMLGSHFNLLEFGGLDKLYAPEGYSTMGYTEWIKDLPMKEPMDWLGLPGDAEVIQREISEKENDEAVDRIIKNV